MLDSLRLYPRLRMLCLLTALESGCTRSGSAATSPQAPCPPPLPVGCTIPPNPRHPTRTDLSGPANEVKALYAYIERLEHTLQTARDACMP